MTTVQMDQYAHLLRGELVGFCHPLRVSSPANKFQGCQDEYSCALLPHWLWQTRSSLDGARQSRPNYRRNHDIVQPRCFHGPSDDLPHHHLNPANEQPHRPNSSSAIPYHVPGTSKPFQTAALTPCFSCKSPAPSMLQQTLCFCSSRCPCYDSFSSTNASEVG